MDFVGHLRVVNVTCPESFHFLPRSCVPFRCTSAFTEREKSIIFMKDSSISLHIYVSHRVIERVLGSLDEESSISLHLRLIKTSYVKTSYSFLKSCHKIQHFATYLRLVNVQGALIYSGYIEYFVAHLHYSFHDETRTCYGGVRHVEGPFFPEFLSRMYLVFRCTSAFSERVKRVLLASLYI